MVSIRQLWKIRRDVSLMQLKRDTEASIQLRHIKMSQGLVTRWLNVDCRGKNFSLQQKYGLQMQDMRKPKLLLKSL